MYYVDTTGREWPEGKVTEAMTAVGVLKDGRVIPFLGNVDLEPGDKLTVRIICT